MSSTPTCYSCGMKYLAGKFSLLLVLLLGISVKLADTATLAGDFEALKQLKASIDPSTIPATSCLGSWDFSVDPCDSSASNVFVCGFQCDNVSPTRRRVTSLTLVGTGYKGTLSPYLGNLTSLVLLDLSGNAFLGSIPDTLGLLSMLQKLDLSRNSLSGPIPESLSRLESLQQLSLANNQLEGPVPTSFSNLSSLQALYLNENLLSGTIPPLGGLTQLNYLVASNNNLSGAIPSSLPLSLFQLSLSNNQLNGTLPAAMGELVQLKVLDLRFNRIDGGIGAELLALSSLQQVNISFNSLTTLDAPNVSSNVSDLIALDLSFNQIGGPLPVFFAYLGELSSLYLRHNRFQGPIPAEYALKAANPPRGDLPFMRLYLDGNNLTGEIPSPFLALSAEFHASFINNCLRSCPSDLTFCQGGGQRPQAECL